MVVLEISKSNRAACRTCHNNIDKDVLKIGTVKSNDGYMNMDWHHETCFWTKRAAQYYKRKGKKCNVLLKVSQFSGQHVLNPAQVEELAEHILASNLKWGSKEALEKAGVVVPVVEKHRDADAPEGTDSITPRGKVTPAPQKKILAVTTVTAPTRGSKKRAVVELKTKGVEEGSEMKDEPVEDVVKSEFVEEEAPQFYPSGRAMRRKTQK